MRSTSFSCLQNVKTIEMLGALAPNGLIQLFQSHFIPMILSPYSSDNFCCILLTLPYGLYIRVYICSESCGTMLKIDSNLHNCEFDDVTQNLNCRGFVAQKILNSRVSSHSFNLFSLFFPELLIIKDQFFHPIFHHLEDWV